VHSLARERMRETESLRMRESECKNASAHEKESGSHPCSAGISLISVASLRQRSANAADVTFPPGAFSFSPYACEARACMCVCVCVCVCVGLLLSSIRAVHGTACHSLQNPSTVNIGALRSRPTVKHCTSCCLWSSGWLAGAQTQNAFLLDLVAGEAS
jgi:hypothetical protein